MRVRPPGERFWAKVNKNGPLPAYAPELGPCWLWTAYLDKHGYGQFGRGDKVVRVHRFSYEQEHGPIPEGLTLDHLCRVHSCVNPSHLEPVTDAVNVMRGVGVTALNAQKTHCPKGHAYAGANLLVSRGYRYCRACLRESNRLGRMARKAVGA